MHEEPRFTRLTMVRLGGGGPGVRRYGLARMDDIALATPPVRQVRRERASDEKPADSPPYAG